MSRTEDTNSATVDSAQLAGEITRESRKHGERIASDIYGPDLELTGDAVAWTLKQFMWNEFYLGVWPPVREMNLLYEEGTENIDKDLDIILALADQVRDEVKHSKLFSRRVEEVGGNPNIMEYEPRDGQVDLFRATNEYDDVVSLAAALQLTAEPLLATFFTTIIQNEVVDRRSRQIIHQAEVDEGNHINTGRMIIERYATDEESKERAWDAHEAVVDAMYDIYE